MKKRATRTPDTRWRRATACKPTKKNIAHLFAWMDDMTQDAQGAREENFRLGKAEKGDLLALDTLNALADKFGF